jgi:hypothetical protein
MGLLGNANPLKVLHGQRLSFFLGHAAYFHRSKHQVVQHRQVREQIELLKHHPYFTSQLLHAGAVIVKHHAIHHNLTLLVFFKPRKAANQCGLARARRPANHHFFTRSDLQMHIIECPKRSKPFGHTLHVNDWLGTCWRRAVGAIFCTGGQVFSDRHGDSLDLLYYALICN